MGYYSFDEEIVDNEVIDHSGNGLNVYTSALDGSITVDGKSSILTYIDIFQLNMKYSFLFLIVYTRFPILANVFLFFFNANC